MMAICVQTCALFFSGLRCILRELLSRQLLRVLRLRAQLPPTAAGRQATALLDEFVLDTFLQRRWSETRKQTTNRIR